MSVVSRKNQSENVFENSEEFEEIQFGMGANMKKFHGRHLEETEIKVPNIQNALVNMPEVINKEEILESSRVCCYV